MVKSLVCLTLGISLTLQGPAGGNLLTNGDARLAAAGWTPTGVAVTEHLAGIPCFTVRGGGTFRQQVTLPVDAVGMYAAVVGRGQAERVNADGAITGLPYLYALVSSADHEHILAYWQGQKMLARPSEVGQWVTMAGVFSVPYGAAFVSIQLKQAERKGVPQDGSAARFADVRMQLFPTEEAARAFIAQYQ
jgi:hypothetical protein